jgi:hypothetical protein
VRLLADALGLKGAQRSEFEATARQDPAAPSQVCVRCTPIGELAERLRANGLDGLGQDVAAVLVRLLAALGTEDIGYGVTGARLSDHTLPVQALPGA